MAKKSNTPNEQALLIFRVNRMIDENNRGKIWLNYMKDTYVLDSNSIKITDEIIKNLDRNHQLLLTLLEQLEA